MARVLIVQKTFIEMFGVMSVASVLKQRGHTVRVCLERGNHLLREAAAFHPDVIGVSAVTMNVHSNLCDAATLKKHFPNTPIIFGGTHTTFFPELIESPHVNAVCRGEGEDAIAEYAEAVLAGQDTTNILNLWVKRDGHVYKNPMRAPIENLDALPFPDRSLYYLRYSFLRNNPVKSFLASRGCPFQCSFCFNKTYRDLYHSDGHPLKPRMRSAESIVEEITALRAQYPLRRISFQDENFCLDKGWLLRFLDIYGKNVALPFFCMLHTSSVNEEIVAALKTAHCYRTTFGVESGDEVLRRDVLKKNTSDDRIREVAALLHKHGIQFHTTNIFSFPEETYDAAMKTLRLNADIAPHSTIAFQFMPFANLELTELALRKRYITESATRDWKNLFKFAVNVPESRQINRLRLLFGLGVRHPRLIPLIVRLCRLPIGPFVAALFYANELLTYASRNRHGPAFILFNLFNLRRLYRSYVRE